MITITIEGTPEGKARPRRGARGRDFTAPETRLYEERLAWAARQAMRGQEPMEGPLCVAVLASFAPPESWSAAKQGRALRGLIRPTVKPDWDNIGKTLDALNRIVWRDDAQVVEATCKKIYAARPGLQVRVWRLGEGMQDELAQEEVAT
jgi:Holliday junction resolvase RusA-like endonuclease